MKKLGLIFMVSVGLIGVLLLVSCQKAEPKTDPASLSRGGQAYDKWWKVVAGATEPKGEPAQWATQTTNTRKGADTWRCKECHGWDYKGKDGAYGKGSHATGFPGVYNASQTKTKAQLADALKGKANPNHNFTSLLGETGVNDVVNFLKEGVIDEAKYIDSATKKTLGANTSRGQELYSKTCVACHGADGKMILFDGKNSLGFLANDNPWEVLHKIRFGQPGTAAMPAGATSGWSTQDAVDVLGYTQTLPAK